MKLSPWYQLGFSLSYDSSMCLLYFLRQGLSLKLKLAVLVRLASELQGSSCPCHFSKVSAGDLNSGPYPLWNKCFTQSLGQLLPSSPEPPPPDYFNPNEISLSSERDSGLLWSNSWMMWMLLRG